MPQNIVVGEGAEQVARFVAEYSGSDVSEEPRPDPVEDGDVAASESGEQPPGETTTSGG